MIQAALLLPLLALTSPGLHATWEQPTSNDDEAFGLSPSWKRTLGSAYSRIAVGAEQLVTFYSDGAQNYLVALDRGDGSSKWQIALGPVYRGHDGSLDGPISSPLLGPETVYALGARGKLVAVDLTSGKTRWSIDLIGDLGAVAPEYGFSTTPLLVDDLLIVQVGGSEGRNLCGLDAKSGELRWSSGEGKGGYQSPELLELAGRRQLVVLNDKEIQGIDPLTGELLWTHTMTGRSSANSGRAAAIDESRFYLYVSSGLVAFHLMQEGDGYVVEELYRSRDIGNSYSMPVYHEGYIYGYRSAFLTCIDVEDGRRVWRSRPPGGAGLTLVGDRLVVFGADGVVAIVRATPEGYQEEARVQALGHSSYSWPTCVDGKIFVRNSEELACLDIVLAEPTTIAAVDGPADSDAEHAFGEFLEELQQAADPAGLIDDYIAAQPSIPVQEHGFVHFLYRGAAEDVAIIGSMTGGSQAHALEHVAGTDLFHKSYEIEAGVRWEYNLQVDYGQPIPDPLNKRQAPGRFSPVSELITEGYETVDYLGEAKGAQGRLETQAFYSTQMKNKRDLQIYLPAGYDESEELYPLILIHQGPDALKKGAMKNALDNLIGTRARSVIAIFISPPRAWWFEAGGSRTEEYLDMLANELVPKLSKRYRISADPADRALMGMRGFGLTAAYGVVAHPEAFGKAIVQSVSLGDITRYAFFEKLAKGGAQQAQIYVDWNRYEFLNKDNSQDLAADSRLLVNKLKEAGAQVSGGEALDSYGWGSWRSRTDDWLVGFFPAK